MKIETVETPTCKCSQNCECESEPNSLPVGPVKYNTAHEVKLLSERFHYDKIAGSIVTSPDGIPPTHWKANTIRNCVFSSRISFVSESKTDPEPEFALSNYYTGITYCIREYMIDGSPITIIGYSKCCTNAAVKKTIKKKGYVKVAKTVPMPKEIKDRFPDAPDTKVDYILEPTTVYVEETVRRPDQFSRVIGKKLAQEDTDETLVMVLADDVFQLDHIELIINREVIPGIIKISW
jgi:hypothetical protein